MIDFLNNQIKIKAIREYIRVHMIINWIPLCVSYIGQHTRMLPVKWLVWDTIAVKKQ